MEPVIKSSKKRPVDGLARFTFYLTLFIFVWPTYADMMVGAIHAKKPVFAILFSLGCFSVILFPAVISLRRLLTDRNLRGRGYIYAIFTILILHLTWMLAALTSRGLY